MTRIEFCVFKRWPVEEVTRGLARLCEPPPHRWRGPGRWCLRRPRKSHSGSTGWGRLRCSALWQYHRSLYRGHRILWHGAGGKREDGYTAISVCLSVCLSKYIVYHRNCVKLTNCKHQTLIQPRFTHRILFENVSIHSFITLLFLAFKFITSCEQTALIRFHFSNLASLWQSGETRNSFLLQPHFLTFRLLITVYVQTEIQCSLSHL